MIVLLEGPDGAGKTTLADQIEIEAGSRGLSTVRTHESAPPQIGDLFRYYWSGLHHGQGSDMVQIADRHHIGNLVYATTRHDSIRLSWTQAEVITKERILDGGGRIIFLVPALSILLERLNRRGEDWPRLRDELDRFEFLGQHLEYLHPRQVRVVDSVLNEESTRALARWALGK